MAYGAAATSLPACPLAVCDGSGWILGPEDVARPCDCREQRLAKNHTRGVSSVIPARFRGVSFDRPPGVCNGAGCIPGPEAVARPSDCREQRLPKNHTRGVSSVIPARFRGVSFARPPVSEMARSVDGRAVVKQVRSYIDGIESNLD